MGGEANLCTWMVVVKRIGNKEIHSEQSRAHLLGHEWKRHLAAPESPSTTPLAMLSCVDLCRP